MVVSSCSGSNRRRISRLSRFRLRTVLVCGSRGRAITGELSGGMCSGFIPWPPRAPSANTKWSPGANFDLRRSFFRPFAMTSDSKYVPNVDVMRRERSVRRVRSKPDSTCGCPGDNCCPGRRDVKIFIHIVYGLGGGLSPAVRAKPMGLERSGGAEAIIAL